LKVKRYRDAVGLPPREDILGLFGGHRLSVLAWLYPTAAMAEVMDKEPSSWAMLLGAALVVSASIVLSRMKWWLALAVLPISGAFAVALMQEILDPYVGPAILGEGGLPYLLIAYGYATVAGAGPILAAILERRRRAPAYRKL
jgi:hypothetical protein